jgi:hypothetical protein
VLLTAHGGCLLIIKSLVTLPESVCGFLSWY